MIDKIEEIRNKLCAAPMMHGDFQLDPMLWQDIMNLLLQIRDLLPKGDEVSND